MVCFRSSISVGNSIHQSRTTSMANTVSSSGHHYPKPRNKKSYTSSKFPVCDGSQSAAFDVLILIAVISACGILFFPYIEFITFTLSDFVFEFVCLAKEEMLQNPTVYKSIALSISCIAVAAWIVVLLFPTRRCRNPNCKGLNLTAEFDIELETEDSVKNSINSNPGDYNPGFLVLPPVYHRELEADLKKLAPPNGRAMLVYRGTCGCLVGRLEVPAPKKQRKVKKWS